jgi:hypothetical protein
MIDKIQDFNKLNHFKKFLRNFITFIINKEC